jgi:hypothetical protein
MQLNSDRNVIFCDLDGVLVDLYTELQIFLYHQYKVWIPKEVCTQYDVHPQLYAYLCERAVSRDAPQSIEAFRNLLDCAFWNSPAHYNTARPHFNFWNALRRWRGPLHFITSRGDSLEEVTIEWLHRWGFTSCPVLFEDKLSGLGTLRSQFSGWSPVFIDDDAEVIQRVEQKLPSIRCYIAAHPWNEWARSKLKSRRRYHHELANMINWANSAGVQL